MHTYPVTFTDSTTRTTYVHANTPEEARAKLQDIINAGIDIYAAGCAVTDTVIDEIGDPRDANMLTPDYRGDPTEIANAIDEEHAALTQ